MPREHGAARQGRSSRPARRSRAGGRRAALDGGRHPEAPCRGAPHWDTRERDTLDVRRETPDRQRTGAGELRDRIEPGWGERGMEAQAPVRSADSPGPDLSSAGCVPRRGSERENSHYTLGKPPPNNCRENQARHRAPGVPWSRVGISWYSTTTAAPKKGSLLDPRFLHIAGLQRLCSPRAPRDHWRGVSLLNWNVGLDYTARRLNCQSANAFVEPRQM